MKIINLKTGRFLTAQASCSCGGAFEYLADDKLRAKQWMNKHPGQGLPPYDVQVCMQCGKWFNPGKQANPEKWKADLAAEKGKAEKARRLERKPNENREHWQPTERLGPDTRTDSSGAVMTPGDRM
jgi:hypothetical protein